MSEDSRQSLGLIPAAFAADFAHWHLCLPTADLAARRPGNFHSQGWSVWYCFGQDDQGEYVDYYACHRMTNDRHVRLRPDGQAEELPAPWEMRLVGQTPEEDARLEAEYLAHNRRVGALLAEKGFLAFSGGPAIEVVKGDITSIPVDAMVNAANKSLIPGGGVDGAIHRAAGPALAEATRALGGCRPGAAVMTPAFDLPARYVIHAVGPVWRGGGYDEDAQLASCYQRALSLAAEYGVQTISFPAISTGIYKFPPERAARVAVREIRRAQAAAGAPDRVILVAFDQATYDILTCSLLSAPRA